MATTVDEIIVENRKAIGILTSEGKRIEANSIIASVAPGQLYKRLLRNNLTSENQEIKFRHGRGNFQIHYALDSSPEWHSGELNKVALIHLSKTAPVVAPAYCG